MKMNAYRTIDSVRLSEVQMQILTMLRVAGGQARVGEIATTRGATIRALESLENSALIEVVDPPPKRGLVPGLGLTWQPDPQKCGVWKLTARGREIAGKLDEGKKSK